MSDDLKKLDDLDKGINKPQPKKDIESFLGWHDLKREDLPYGGRLFPKNYIFQVQAASAGTIAHYSAMDESNPLSVQAALTHVIKNHIRIMDGKRSIDPLTVIHESMRFWFAMMVHTYTGNATALEATETCPSCKKQTKMTITPFVIEFQEMSDYVNERIDEATGKIFQKTKTYGTLEFSPITLSVRAELMAFMQEKFQKKEDFDMQFLSYYPLFHSERGNQSIEEVYKKLYFPLTKDKKKFSVFTQIIRRVALDQLLQLSGTCSHCAHRFRYDISRTTGLRDIFLDANANDELL